MTEHIGSLKPDPKNARRHTPRNVGMIVSALHEVGAARSIVIDEDDVILAGNATVEAAAQAGIERLKVVEADGNTIVAVRRRGLTPEQKARLALFDNRSAELAEWDADVLAALNEELDLSGLWDDGELTRALASIDDDFDPRAEWQGMPEFEQEDLTPVKQLTVNFASADDIDAFAQLVGQKVGMTTKSIWFPPQPIERYMDKGYVGADDAT